LEFKSVAAKSDMVQRSPPSPLAQAVAVAKAMVCVGSLTAAVAQLGLPLQSAVAFGGAGSLAMGLAVRVRGTH
jgi:hypothetical protein